MGANTSQSAACTREVLDSVRWIFQALRESSRRAERQVGLSGAQLFVLQKLAESPGLSLNELADRTHTHQSSVSTVVSRLVARRFVQRARAAEDGRRVELTLTARGRAAAAEAPDAAQDRLIAAIEAMPAYRRRLLAEGLAELAHGVAATHRRAPMFFDDGHSQEDGGGRE
jgi:DNA-binding MarR family transcriptional regulator